MPTLSNPGLPARLQTWAQGDFTCEAAVAHLVAHDTWLHRTDFVGACVQLFDCYDYRADDTVPAASVDWDAIPAFLNRDDVGCSSSEASMLRLAAELAGVDTGQPLSTLILGLDVTNVAIVLDAIARVAAWHERHQAHTVTGWPEARS